MVERLVTQGDPTIQEYEVHELKKDAINLEENRMPIAFKIVGLSKSSKGLIDPRAGRVEIVRRLVKKDLKTKSVKVQYGLCKQKHF